MDWGGWKQQVISRIFQSMVDNAARLSTLLIYTSTYQGWSDAVQSKAQDGPGTGVYWL